MAQIMLAAAAAKAMEPTPEDAKTSLPALSTVPIKYSKVPGTIRAKVRYGPYTLPSTKSASISGTLFGDDGMTDMIKPAQKPCTDCTLLFANAGLEYANGTEANTDTGSWLHHIVMLNIGPGRADAACGIPGADPFFTNGNERELKAYTSLDGSFNSGYYIQPKDNFILYSELMNMDPIEKHVWITIYYEYLPGRPAGYQNTKAIWIQLGQCGQPDTDGSGKKVFYTGMPLNDKAFQESSAPWTAKQDGTVVFVSGHLHDGGTGTKIYKNDQMICDSETHYGETPAYHQELMPGMNMPTEHISSVTPCFMPTKMTKGDKFYQTSFYNFTEHPGMRTNRGTLDEIMGISVMYVAFPQDAAPSNGTARV